MRQSLFFKILIHFGKLKKGFLINEMIKNIQSCSNLECTNSITEYRDASEMTEAEKKYGLLCNFCRFRMEQGIQFIVVCLNCETLVDIKYFIDYPADTKYIKYCKTCRACGGTKKDERVILSKKPTSNIFINLKKLFKWQQKKKQENRKQKKLN